MRTKSIDMVSEFVDLAHLNAQKLQQLDRVLRSILALPIAQDTFAQIIDENTTWQSSPSHVSREQYEKFRRAFIVHVLKLNTQLIQKYQSVPIGSSEHTLRLLEVTAASIHTLAGTMLAYFHPEMDVIPEKPPGGHLRAFHGTDSFYVDFHDDYVQVEDYPFGLLDVVGYWAETQLFGGILLFDRGESGSEVQ